jgi:hypothetical protein
MPVLMLIRPSWKSRFKLKEDCWVFVPNKESMIYGLELKEKIQSRWTPPSFYYHLRDGGHVAAIKSHLTNSSFCHLDIRHFFNNVSRSKVTRSLVPFFGYEMSREAACNSTVKSPGKSGYSLPYGFVQSSILASLSLSKSTLGKKLAELKKSTGITVSVYVDDIILSAKDPDVLQNAVAAICAAAERSKFPINEIKKEGPAPIISSFNIELTHATLSIKKDRIKRFQEALTESKNIHQVKGILNYAGTINTGQRDMLASHVNPALAE